MERNRTLRSERNGTTRRKEEPRTGFERRTLAIEHRVVQISSIWFRTSLTFPPSTRTRPSLVQQLDIVDMDVDVGEQNSREYETRTASSIRICLSSIWLCNGQMWERISERRLSV